MKKLRELWNKGKWMIPHGCVILSLLFTTFFIADRFNRAMDFIGNEISKWLLLVFCILSAISSLILIRINRRR